MTTTHTCNCTACNGLSFTAPEGYLPAKDYAVAVHNYAHMVRNPVMGPVMASRGLVAV